AGSPPESPATATGTSVAQRTRSAPTISRRRLQRSAAIPPCSPKTKAGRLSASRTERTAAVEGEPHQGDVVERVADLARRDGAEEEPEVSAPQEPERRGASGPRELALARQVEHRIGHRPSVIYA